MFAYAITFSQAHEEKKRKLPLTVLLAAYPDFVFLTSDNYSLPRTESKLIMSNATKAKKTNKQ
jgi:hypothetical protein